MKGLLSILFVTGMTIGIISCGNDEGSTFDLEYVVIGITATQAHIGYTDASGVYQKELNATLPWSKTIQIAKGTNFSYQISLQVPDTEAVGSEVRMKVNCSDINQDNYSYSLIADDSYAEETSTGSCREGIIDE